VHVEAVGCVVVVVVVVDVVGCYFLIVVN